MTGSQGQEMSITKARKNEHTTNGGRETPSFIDPVRAFDISCFRDPDPIPASSSVDAVPVLSVVVPVHNEAGNAAPLFTEIREVMTAIGRSFEVIFVNDGSTDATLAQLRTQAAQHQCLRIVDLDGNFGEAAALSAGFQAARGELVITLDGDGQNDPHDIPRLLDTLERQGYRVVSGWRQRRQPAGVLFRVLPSRVANRLIAMVSGIPMHDNGCGLKVYRRDVVATAALPRGMNRFLPAIFGIRATEVAEVPVNDRRRRHGESHYGISRTLAVLRDLLALRLLIADAQRAQWVCTVVAVLGLLCGISALWGGSIVGVAISGLAVIVASMIWWNLRRFREARIRGVFRVRREYSAAEGV
jgi:glycosyltransferase involved in cell wall biosynthesis